MNQKGWEERGKERTVRELDEENVLKFFSRKRILYFGHSLKSSIGSYI